MTNTSPSSSLVTFPAGSLSDLAEVKALLSSSGLPHADLDGHVAELVLAREGSALVGVAGLERHGQDGLLRSVCVAPGHRGRGLAAALCDRVEGRARGLGLGQLYLLTTTAQAYFARRGYAVCARDDAPRALQDSAEFRALCPSTAVCMRRAP